MLRLDTKRALKVNRVFLLTLGTEKTKKRASNWRIVLRIALLRCTSPPSHHHPPHNLHPTTTSAPPSTRHTMVQSTKMKLQTPSGILCMGRRRILRNTNDYIRVLLEKFVTQTDALRESILYTFGSARIFAEIVLSGTARREFIQKSGFYCIKNLFLHSIINEIPLNCI